MIKSVFCDLDYTLLTDSKELLVDILISINELRKQGRDFIICSGRMPFLIKNIANILKLSSKDYIVCANGGIVCNGQGKPIMSYPIEKKCVGKILNYAIENKIGLFVSSINEINCINKETIELTKIEGHVKLNEISHKDMVKFVESDIYKMSLVYPDYSFLHQVQDYLRNVGNLSSAFSSKTTVEIVNGNRCKGKAVLDIMEMKNIKPDEIAVIGDNMNDISMFEVTENCYCPKNATEEIKVKSNYISIKSNNESAVADIIWKKILRKGD